MKHSFIVLLSILFLSSCSDNVSPNIEDEEAPESLEVTTQDDNDYGLIEEITFELQSEKTYNFDSGSEEVLISPIAHATAVIEWGDTVIYVDPAEDFEAYDDFRRPDIILITHIHDDHLNQDVVSRLYQLGAAIIVPQSVMDELSEEIQSYASVVENDILVELGDFTITMIPAYNLREEALSFHPQERGDNGYIIEKDGFRVYFSGDSEDTPEMRALSDIDVAFISMNLPYTMTAESAADAVLEFQPETVFPYHFRGQGGFTDISVFRDIVNEGNSEIDVILHDWYEGE